MDLLSNKLNCLCCGKPFAIAAPRPNMSGAGVDCPHCGYEHVIEVRAGKVARVQTTGGC